MLILTRKLGESIVIGNGGIKISILDFNGKQLRVGIEAPRDIPVHRGEVYEAIQEQNRQAADSNFPITSTLLKQPPKGSR